MSTNMPLKINNGKEMFMHWLSYAYKEMMNDI